MNNSIPSPRSFLQGPITGEYVPYGFSSFFYLTRNRPVFTQMVIREMLADPRVLFGLWLIKGPIQDKASFDVECSDAAVSEFVHRQINRFWRNSVTIALKALDWGYSGSEVLYTVRNRAPVSHDPFTPPSGFVGQPNRQPVSMGFPPGETSGPSNPDYTQPLDQQTQAEVAQSPTFSAAPELFIEFDRLKDIHSADLQAVTLRGELVGMYVHRGFNSDIRQNNYNRRLYIGHHKKFWHVHWAEKNPWYGLSRLFGAFIPWWEKWSDGGFRDIRRLWFHKNAFEGGTLYYPAGGSTRDENGNIISFKDLGRELLEKKRSGGMLFLPGTVTGDGRVRQWEYIPAQSNAVPAGLLDYGNLLDKEILEGMGVPTEIIESSGEQGFGAASGRQVPETAFYAILQSLVNILIDDFKKQVLEPLVLVNFGPGIEFDVIPVPMTASTDPATQQPVPSGQNIPPAE